MRPDKAKVVDEVWDEARIVSFLEKGPMGDENSDFSKLLHAYRSMRAEDFTRFLSHFVAAGGDLTATDREGQTLIALIRDHKKSAPFVAALEHAMETAQGQG